MNQQTTAGGHIDPDDLATLAVGALPAEEAQPAIEHIKACDDCAEQFATYAETASAVAAALEERSPRAELGQRIVAAIESSNVVDIEDERARRGPRNIREIGGPWETLAASADAAGALAFLGFLTIDARNDADEAEERVADLEESLTEGQVITMTGSEEAPDAAVALIVAPDGESATVIARNLPENDEDHVYQLWLFAGEEPQSVSTFDIEEGDVFQVALEGDLLASDAMAITLEEGDGSPTPLGPVYVSGELT
jgi:anti-sigma-K factor RskA